MVQSNDINHLKNLPIINPKNIQNQGGSQGRQGNGNGLIAQFQYQEEESKGSSNQAEVPERYNQGGQGQVHRGNMNQANGGLGAQQNHVSSVDNLHGQLDRL